MTRRALTLAVAIWALAGTGAVAQDAFRPDLYFAGRTRSAGVLEGGLFGPSTLFAGVTRGRQLAPGLVTFDQVIRFSDGMRQTRRWVLRRTGPNTYTATANGVVGEARGVVDGRLLRLTYTLVPDAQTGPVQMDQAMLLQGDGVTLSNRTTVSKFGLPVRSVNEVFTRAGRGAR